MSNLGEGSIEVRVTADFGGRPPRTAIAELKQALLSAVEEASLAVANALLADSRAFVPVLSGKLLDSGRVERIVGLEDALVYHRVVYGSDTVVYAQVQHDEPFNHPSLGFFGRARYLKRPMELNGRFYQELYDLVLAQRLGPPT